MAAMCCPLSSGDGGDGSDEETDFERVITRGQKPRWCGECGEQIPHGARYEYHRGNYGGRGDLDDPNPPSWSTHRTCLLCVEIRNHFSCGNGWIYGQLWEDLAENFFPDMTAGGPCMEGLSPAAKACLFEARVAWLFANDVERAGAPPPAPEVRS